MEIGKTRLKEIEIKASEVLDRIDTDLTEPIDVIQIANELGFVVGNAELGSDMDGFIIIDEGKDDILGIKTDKLIGVRASQTLEWKRFVIAHEIGHYILHYNREADNGMYAHRDHMKGKNETENEADYFAANLLMPKEMFVKKYEELKEKNLSADEMTVLLANKFGVTENMTKRRFGELSISAE